MKIFSFCGVVTFIFCNFAYKTPLFNVKKTKVSEKTIKILKWEV